MADGVQPQLRVGTAQKKRLKSFNLGRKRMIARSAIEAFIEAGGTSQWDTG